MSNAIRSEHDFAPGELPDLRGQATQVGRYLLHRQIARGGMATIHIARLMGDEGFSRIVAAKRLLPEFAEDAEFVAMFLDEARIASKVHHRNVVPVLDVVVTGEEVILVQEYVHGVPLHTLLRTAYQARDRIPLEIAVSIACQVLAGLHAAHETVDELGTPLSIVHRDVSPQNVMVAIDGTARLLDFGVAKATMAAHVTRDGTFKGKLAYSAPEQLRGQATRQSDVYSLSVMLWELLVGHRMHQAPQAEAELIAQVMAGRLPKLTEALASERDAIGIDRWEQLVALESIVNTGLAVAAKDRWVSAADMEQALSHAVSPARPSQVAAWLRTLGKDFLDKHEKLLAAEEASWRRQATGISRRLVLPGEPRRTTYVGPPEYAPPVPELIQPAPARAGSKVIVAVSGAIAAVALAFGIVFAVRGSPTAASVAPTVTDPASPPASPSVPAQPPSPPLPAQTAGAQPDYPVVPPPPAIDVVDVQTSTHPAAAPTRTPVRPPARPTGRQPQPPRRAVARTPAAPTADVDETPAPAAAKERDRDRAERDDKDKARQPASDCTPPYYFEGSKKIFKPACL